MLEAKVNQFLQNNNLIKDDYIIVAVSGGVDSMVLLDILYKLKFNIVIAHVDHHKRIESELEKEYIKNYALENNMIFELLDFYDDHTDNFHNNAHNARYQFFKVLADKYHTNLIYTAHHADDNLETIIMKIIEGSNLYGYGGISRIYDDDEYKVIRPLLEFFKDELYEYAKINKLTYFEDSSNKEDYYLRNRIRHNIIPLLKEESNNINKKIVEYSNILKESFEYIRKDSIRYLNENNDIININNFILLDKALRKDIICLMLEKENIRKSYSLIEDINNMLNSNLGSKRIILENNNIFIREYDKAYIKKIKDYINLDIRFGIDDEVIYNNKYKIYFSKNKPIVNAKFIHLCYNNLKLPFGIRKKMDSDTINLLIGRKKLSRLFIDEKIPKEERNEIPVIYNNDNIILWVYDIAKSKEVFDEKEKGDIYLVVERI